MASTFQQELHLSLDLLHRLTEHDPPLKPLGELNPKLLASCSAVFFMHSTKVGLGVGYKWGRGLLVVRQASGWSSPTVYTIKEASFGVSAGVSRVQTMLIFGNSTALDKFQKSSKAGSLVVGTDFKVVALSDLGLGSTESAGNLVSTDAVALSLADGIMVDLSLAGGTISFDTTTNEGVYGKNVSPEHLIRDEELGSADAPGVAHLHEALDEIAAAADADPRRFTGFQKRWKPQSVFQENGKMHVGVDAHTKSHS